MYVTRLFVSGSDCGVRPRYVSAQMLPLEPNAAPHCHGKLRLRSTPTLFGSAQVPFVVFTFLRHSTPPSARLRPSGFVCSTKWKRKLSSSHVASSLTPYSATS